MRESATATFVRLAAAAAFLLLAACADNGSGDAQAPTATATVVVTFTPTRTSTATPSAVPTHTPTRTATSTPSLAPLTSAQVLERGSYGVGVTTMVFVDSTRPTMANGSYGGSPERLLKTEIWYPTAPDENEPPTGSRDAPLALSGVPYPLVVYSHGFMDARTGGAYLARHLASHGYVIASADFPLTSSGAPGGPNLADVPEQPRDVSFIIDRLLELNAEPGGPLSGAIDPDRIGLTGLSLGALTTSLAAFHATLRDPRARAAAVIAGPGCFFGGSFYDTVDIPLLLLHGDIDAIVPYEENAMFAFQQARPPVYLVTVKGGTHTSFTDIAAPLFDALNNPDELGCTGLGSSISGGDDSAFLDRLGGPEAGIIMGNCPAPCAAPTPLPAAIKATRQHELTLLSVFPFFESYLRDDQREREFLRQTIAAENSEVTVAFEPGAAAQNP